MEEGLTIRRKSSYRKKSKLKTCDWKIFLLTIETEPKTRYNLKVSLFLAYLLVSLIISWLCFYFVETFNLGLNLDIDFFIIMLNWLVGTSPLASLDTFYKRCWWVFKDVRQLMLVPKYFLLSSSFFKRLNSKSLVGCHCLTFWHRFYCYKFYQPCTSYCCPHLALTRLLYCYYSLALSLWCSILAMIYKKTS